MARTLQYIFPASNTSDVCKHQVTAGAGYLTLNGNLAVAGNNNITFLTTPTTTNVAQGYSRNVSVTTNTNCNVTVNGIQNGRVLTEIITGHANTTTYGVDVFDVITSVYVNTATSGITLGTGLTGFFPIITIDLDRDVINYTLTTGSSNLVSTALFGGISNIAYNDSTYLNTVNNNNNIFKINANNLDQYVYSNAGNPTYSYLLVQVININNINNSMELNFLQI
jgi:uncharacterized protein YsxB (DUF464 family)